jgi:hypothetical protein
LTVAPSAMRASDFAKASDPFSRASTPAQSPPTNSF